MTRFIVHAFLGMSLSAAALASDASTSASVGSANGRPGVATATAQYQGDNGFARTDTRSGPVDVARGVAVGVDQNGLSLSISNAIATRNGTAIATNFNLEIEADGDVSWSRGSAVSRGQFERSASAGGSAGSVNGQPVAVSTASGRTDDRGVVRVATESHSELARHPHKKIVLRERR